MAYRTEQRERLVEHLRAHAEEQFTASDLTRALAGAGIAQATVYRLLKRLSEEGVVRAFSIGDGHSTYYQYIDGEACGTHLHLKCTVCGRLYHLGACVSEFLEKQILATHRFALDEQRTMLFGTCHKCRGGK